MRLLQRTVILTVMVLGPVSLSAETSERFREADPKPRLATQQQPARTLRQALEPGWRAYQRGEIAEALTIYQGAVASSPNDPSLWYDLGCLYALHHDEAMARSAFQRALTLNPRLAHAMDALGQLEEQAGHVTAAHALYANADILEPGNAKFLRHLIRALLRLNESAAARQALRQLLAATSEDGEAHYELGVLELRANAPDLAIQEFRRVVERQPNHVMAWNGLALASARAGAFAEALDAIEHARALNPQSASTETNFGVVAAYQQRGEDARAAWQHALKLDPHFQPAAQNLEALTASPTP